MMQEYILSLGSDMGDRLDNLKMAIKKLEQRGAISQISAVYETMPVNMDDNAFFLNCALIYETEYEPESMLSFAKSIESEMGRVFSTEYLPRPIDIDLISWSEGPFQSSSLTIPHIQAAQRRFVIVPVNEIRPGTFKELDSACQFVDLFCGADELR